MTKNRFLQSEPVLLFAFKVYNNSSKMKWGVYLEQVHKGFGQQLLYYR
jgi:hypothetical protein